MKDLEQQLQALGIQSLQETGRPVSANPTYSGSSSTIAMDELMVASTQPSATPNVEVSLVDSHASIKIQSGRRSRQLLGLVKGLQSVGLSVLHLNVHSVEGTAFYSLSVKVILIMCITFLVINSKARKGASKCRYWSSVLHCLRWLPFLFRFSSIPKNKDKLIVSEVGFSRSNLIAFFVNLSEK